MSRSAICEGTVHHVRLAPRAHAFRYRLFLMELDLDELPQLFRGRWLWSARKPNLAWFRRADYLGPPERPLREAVLDRVEAELGRRPDGAVRVLTQLRTFGYVFNPVSFYLCHAANGALEAFVAQITNTPWRERHTYVLDARRGGAREPAADGAEVALRWRFAKEFHVSPFHAMHQEYEWRLRIAGKRFEIDMENLENGRAVFHAGFAGERLPITGPRLARALVRFPLLPLALHAAIHWQAARLWLKGTPFHDHPRSRRAEPAAPSSR